MTEYQMRTNLECITKCMILLLIVGLFNVNPTTSMAQSSQSSHTTEPQVQASGNRVAQSANQNGSTLREQQFYLAVKQNNVNAVKGELSTHFKAHTLDSMPPNNSALHWAAWEGASDVMAELLKQQDVQIDVLNAVNETPLMIAALKANIPVMRQLIAAGAYPNKEGWTPLHYAASMGHVDAMKLLLDEHAYIDAESPNKTTPLMMAARSTNILAVKLLLDEGADFELKNQVGWDVITFAEKANATDIVEGLKLRAAAFKIRQAKPPWMR